MKEAHRQQVPCLEYGNQGALPELGLGGRGLTGELLMVTFCFLVLSRVDTKVRKTILIGVLGVYTELKWTPSINFKWTPELSQPLDHFCILAWKHYTSLLKLGDSNVIVRHHRNKGCRKFSDKLTWIKKSGNNCNLKIYEKSGNCCKSTFMSLSKNKILCMGPELLDFNNFLNSF